VRKRLCVPMMILCLSLCGCGGNKAANEAEALRQPYRDMSGCTMEAEITCGAGTEDLLTFSVRCDCVPTGESTVEILAPESIAGVKAIVDGRTLKVEYAGACLNMGTLSSEKLSPAACLPQLIAALREGWLLEENREELGGVSCRRLCLDQTGENGGKVVSAVWLNEEKGTPVFGEISVEDEIILQARFTGFQFGDILAK